MVSHTGHTIGLAGRVSQPLQRGRPNPLDSVEPNRQPRLAYPIVCPVLEATVKNPLTTWMDMSTTKAKTFNGRADLAGVLS